MTFDDFIKNSCLYCDRLFVDSITTSYTFGSITIHECTSCKERFTLSRQIRLGFSNSVFSFTCNDMSCSIHLENETFCINPKPLDECSVDANLAYSLLEYPCFSLDFKNKEKLCQKLKTYMTFS